MWWEERGDLKEQNFKRRLTSCEDDVLEVNFDTVLLPFLHSADELRVVQPHWRAWLLMCENFD